MERLGFLLERGTIVGLAILGAALAAAASGFMKRNAKAAARPVRALLWLGYGITVASMLLFIIAGFLSGR